MHFALFRDNFFNMFAYLSMALVLVFFLQLFHPIASNAIHFQHVLSTSFQVSFLIKHLGLLMPLGGPFGIISQKKTVPAITSKKEAPLT